MLYLPIDSLPNDPKKRSGILEQYFTEHIASSELINDSWQIDLFFPDFSDFYIDPHLIDGLLWWEKNFLLSDIPLAFKTEKGFQLSLNDSWTLFSWSQWLADYVKKIGVPSEVVILHIDDHDDLMSPRIINDGLVWKDLITGQELDLFKPDSIRCGIESGAIGIGSFIAPIIHKIPRVHVRHLCATGYSTTRKGLYSLQPTLFHDDLIAPEKKRLAVKLVPCAGQVSPHANTYRVTANVDEWLQDLPNGVPILLHIDMDYFNNRFNGDSDWELYKNSHDPSGEELLLSIDSVFHALAQQEVIGNICDVAIALSPRFFPAEFWQMSIDRIRGYLGTNP